MSNIHEFLAKVKDPIAVGEGQWMAHCPSHDDRKRSLSIKLTSDGKILVHCFAGCEPREIVQAVGLTLRDLFLSSNNSTSTKPSVKPKDTGDAPDSEDPFVLGPKAKPTATYDYEDERGNFLYRIVRYDRGGVKEFKVWHREGSGFRPGLGGQKLVLYLLPDVVAARNLGEPVYVVEGEKDADRLKQLGFTATTNPFGAGKWQPEFSRYLEGLNVWVIPDNDEPGRKHAADVLEATAPYALGLHLLELADLPDHGDVSDWLDAGHDAAELDALAWDCEDLLASEGALEAAIRRLRGGSDGPDGDAQAPCGPGQAKITVWHNPKTPDAVAEAAEAALIQAGAPIFVRDDKLQVPKIKEVEAADGRKVKTILFGDLDKRLLRSVLEHVAAFRVLNEATGAAQDIAPPLDICETILSRSIYWTFPEVAGIITCPTLRRDGSVLATPGYDPVTRLYLVPGVVLPAMPARPTKDDAARELMRLVQLLNEFPFAGWDGPRSLENPSLAVALSELITPVVRAALGAVPMHVNTSPERGTGKSYLCDVAAAIALGHFCPAVSASAASHEELDKKLSAEALQGLRLFSIDNVSIALSSDLLCQMIERPLVHLRPLGASRVVPVENRFTIFATGNNLTISGDLTRRVLRCEMDVNEERPELRRFSHKPYEEVLANRGLYVAACLTIVRAYMEAGCPDELPPLASFESWSRYVRSALVWLGCADPVDTMEQVRSDDPRLAELTAVVEAWAEAFGSEDVSAREMAARAETHPELRDALLAVARGRDGVDPKTLGYWLRKQRNRVVGQWKIVRPRFDHHRGAIWRLLPKGEMHD